MSDGGETRGPVRTRAFLIDAAAMTVAWSNEAAAADHPDTAIADIPLDALVPVPGVPEALREVAATGVPRHLSAGLVSTHRGSMAVVASIYRLPDGMLLLLSDNAFKASHRPRDEGGQHARTRGRRR